MSKRRRPLCVCVCTASLLRVNKLKLERNTSCPAVIPAAPTTAIARLNPSYTSLAPPLLLFDTSILLDFVPPGARRRVHHRHDAPSTFDPGPGPGPAVRKRIREGCRTPCLAVPGAKRTRAGAIICFRPGSIRLHKRGTRASNRSPTRPLRGIGKGHSSAPWP